MEGPLFIGGWELLLISGVSFALLSLKTWELKREKHPRLKTLLMFQTLAGLLFFGLVLYAFIH